MTGLNVAHKQSKRQKTGSSRSLAFETMYRSCRTNITGFDPAILQELASQLFDGLDRKGAYLRRQAVSGRITAPTWLKFTYPPLSK